LQGETRMAICWPVTPPFGSRVLLRCAFTIVLGGVRCSDGKRQRSN
jgi:hypothetical protein